MDRQVRANDSREPEHLVNSQEGHAPSIRHAQAQADLRGQAARQLPAHGPDLVRVLDSARALDSVRVLGLAAQRRRPVKPRARSALVHEAADEASSSTPRPRKAR